MNAPLPAGAQFRLLAYVLNNPDCLEDHTICRCLMLASSFTDHRARWLAKQIILTGADVDLIRTAATQWQTEPPPPWNATLAQRLDWREKQQWYSKFEVKRSQPNYAALPLEVQPVADYQI